ncbi:hypothetical protein TIFTF001_022020 [Ficus carica]|uniref:Uncharacterized protein n=1 Tax=Ficus carica TaxID=3494 RepID=A0AA88DCH4_FICCA|nr:hypothetical protein TIFTF001_022020 [Ficus carica]
MLLHINVAVDFLARSTVMKCFEVEGMYFIDSSFKDILDFASDISNFSHPISDALVLILPTLCILQEALDPRQLCTQVLEIVPHSA